MPKAHERMRTTAVTWLMLLSWRYVTSEGQARLLGELVVSGS